MGKERQPKLPGIKVKYRNYDEFMKHADFRVAGATRAWVEEGAKEAWNGAIALAAYKITSQAKDKPQADVREVLQELAKLRVDLY